MSKDSSKEFEQELSKAITQFWLDARQEDATGDSYDARKKITEAIKNAHHRASQELVREALERLKAKTFINQKDFEQGVDTELANLGDTKNGE